MKYRVKPSIAMNLFFISFFLMLVTPVIAAPNSDKPLTGKNGIVAYTWNSSPSARQAILSTSSYTFNYGRSVDRVRSSKGIYQVHFKGLRCNRGQFTVNAYGGTAFKSCRIGSWSGKDNCEVSVYCFDAKGDALDSQFNLLFVD